MISYLTCEIIHSYVEELCLGLARVGKQEKIP